jgi:hypothetical protein
VVGDEVLGAHGSPAAPFSLAPRRPLALDAPDRRKPTPSFRNWKVKYGASSGTEAERRARGLALYYVDPLGPRALEPSRGANVRFVRVGAAPGTAAPALQAMRDAILWARLAGCAPDGRGLPGWWCRQRAGAWRIARFSAVFPCRGRAPRGDLFTPRRRTRSRGWAGCSERRPAGAGGSGLVLVQPTRQAKRIANFTICNFA